jgi:antirestriction protein ArdC
MISKAEMASRVVAPITAAMEQGDLLWLRGWNQGIGAGFPHNPTKPAAHAPYRGGVNNMLMMLASMINGWGDNRWMGYRQARDKGWTVRQGEKSTEIYAPIMGSFLREEDGKKVWVKYVKGFNVVHVFNAQQIDGIPPLEEPADLDVATGYDRAMGVYCALGITTTHAGERAAYNPVMDSIIMPPEGAFKSPEDYHATRLHEVGHATGHKGRLDRKLFGVGEEAYAQEELIAELFSAFACADVGIEKKELTMNHAAYLQHWHKRLGEKPELFTDAVTAAWKALEWVREQVWNHREVVTRESVEDYAQASDGGWK